MFFFFSNPSLPLSLVGFRDRFNTPTFRFPPLPSFIVIQSRHASSSSSRYPSRCTTTNQLTNQPTNHADRTSLFESPLRHLSITMYHSFFFFFAAKLYNWPMRLVTMKMDFSQHHKKKKLLISYYHQSFISSRYAKKIPFFFLFLKKKKKKKLFCFAPFVHEFGWFSFQISVGRTESFFFFGFIFLFFSLTSLTYLCPFSFFSFFFFVITGGLWTSF